MTTGRKGTGMARILLALVVLVSAVPALVQAQESEQQSGNPLVFGVASHAWWLDPLVYGDQLLPALDDLQVTTVRLGIDWKRFEATQGVYDWSLYDRVFGELAKRNILIIANFNTIPAWASVDQEGCSQEQLEIYACQLREDAYPAFEQAIEAAVSRYAWIEHWEYWNEPEMWTHLGQDGSTYLRMLKSFYDIAHRVNPEVTVAAQTLVGHEYMGYIYNLSEVAYGAGNEPWDAISIHPYNFEYSPVPGERPLEINYDRMNWLRDLMISRGDEDMKVWVTEYGWYLDEQQQTHNLIRTLDWLQAQSYIEFAHIHMLHDWTDEWGQVFGLMEIVPDQNGNRYLTPTTQFRAKPFFYYAFKDYPKDRYGHPPSAAPDVMIVPETGHTVEGRFLRAWNERGGLEVLGFPVTRPYYRQQDDGSWLLVQDFERMRFEFHPEYVGTDFDVLGQLMGNITAEGRRGEPEFLPRPDCETTETTICFSETGHMLYGNFRAFWETRGGLMAFGFPISTVFEEDGLIVQYFERARIEDHGNGLFLLGALVRDELHLNGWMGPGSLIDVDPRAPTRRQFP